MGPIQRVTAPTVDVLTVLLEADEPMWGLAIAKQSGRTPASIYPILSRLEEGGWVAGSWDVDEERTGPRRRLFRFTEAGRTGARHVVNDYVARHAPAPQARARLA
ncbi:MULTISPECIES: PadR family transcriptional regulator [Microbacterium]|uniref:PadR family transcriptional regulator n=1 Tax=Microbacterium dauci TaxID=3048008 RepID=A0ABT6ZFM6_9MICO|nr:PadR family transcriptional regulator [Microbacterium sp. LX3-4]MDJ1114949.1 PadR family transcriptional regulator [Microbacterium sp. LX3-4]